MNINLDRIENSLRELFEYKLLKIFTGNKRKITLIDDLIRAMRENLIKDTDEKLLAPDQYDLKVSHKDIAEWRIHQDILNQMTATIYRVGISEGIIFREKPSITLIPSEAVSKSNYDISASISPKDSSMPDTAAMERPELRQIDNPIPANASFVIGGKTNVPLDRVVINIGRHSDNDLVFDDPHVSRHHAQLRAINQQYVIFDVGSLGGIFLNSKQISQATLQAGDVIRIGTVNLIYIQDTTAASPTTAMLKDPHDDFIGENPA